MILIFTIFFILAEAIPEALALRGHKTIAGIIEGIYRAAVTARGVCWATTQNPTTADSYTTNGTGTGLFVSNITGLSKTTTYYVRAYATNSVGTSYGAQYTFKTPSYLIVIY